MASFSDKEPEAAQLSFTESQELVSCCLATAMHWEQQDSGKNDCWSYPSHIPNKVGLGVQPKQELSTICEIAKRTMAKIPMQKLLQTKCIEML